MANASERSRIPSAVASPGIAPISTAIGGTTEAHLNITWNYGGHFRRVLGDGGIRSIYQKTGADTIPVLQYAAEQLGDDTDEDYWKPTEGNAKAAILQLLAMAKMRPDGVWEGD